MRLLIRVLLFFAGALALFLAVGVVLPGEWSTERSMVIRAGPERVYPFISGPRGWEGWSLWPEAGMGYEGPDSGPGAVRVWDDPDYGDGRFTILAAEPGVEVRYRVEVQGGSLRFEGTVRLEAVPDGTRVVWREEGDFGWNPLLGYAARQMSEAQGAQFEQSLERLRTLVEAGPQ
jgi:hypothetical protein